MRVFAWIMTAFLALLIVAPQAGADPTPMPPPPPVPGEWIVPPVDEHVQREVSGEITIGTNPKVNTPVLETGGPPEEAPPLPLDACGNMIDSTASFYPMIGEQCSTPSVEGSLERAAEDLDAKIGIEWSNPSKSLIDWNRAPGPNEVLVITGTDVDGVLSLKYMSKDEYESMESSNDQPSNVESLLMGILAALVGIIIAFYVIPAVSRASGNKSSDQPEQESPKEYEELTNSNDKPFS